MNTIIDLLKQKNSYLKNFKQLSVREHTRVQNGDFSHLNKFYYKRKALLESIEKLDKQLNQQKDILLSLEDKKIMLNLLQEKRGIVMSILDKDLRIYSYFSEKEQQAVKSQIA